MASSERDRLVRFGVFEVDLEAGELRRGGVKVRIQEQPFRLLALLLERPGRLVPREEIRRRLWPEDTFVDFDHGLNTAVNKLRDALGDTATNPRFVETLPRRGYRFIAPVEGAADPEPEGEAGGPSRSILATREALPPMAPGLARALFGLLQVFYLGLYIAALVGLEEIEVLVDRLVAWPLAAFVFLLVTALVGIATRLYLLAATILGYRGLNDLFLRLFAFVFVLDELWAATPLLLWPFLGLGASLALCAVLAFAPFAQRSLLLMASRTSGPARR